MDARNKGESVFRFKRSSDLRRLRDALIGAGFTREALGEITKHALLDLPLLMRLTDSGSPAHNLIRLFKLAQPVPIKTLQSALAPFDLDELIEGGLLRRSGDCIISETGLTPEINDSYVAYDFDPGCSGEPQQANHVLEVGPSSQTLAALTVRRKCGRALDLCAGAGIQSLLASRHCAAVVGTDINCRALNFADFNARLNGISNLELRHGNLFEPVSGEKFDLITANPPYIISPDVRYTYRDSGLPGDSVCEDVIRTIPDHLEDGGFCSVLFNWHHRGEDDWTERPLKWTTGNGCDVWLLQFGTQPPAPYAYRWLRHCEGRNGVDLAKLLDTWLAYYDRMGMGVFSFGLLVMRRRINGSNWVRTDTMQPEWTAANCSDQILRIFAAQDFVTEIDDDNRFLDQRFALSPDHEMRHLLRAENGSWVVTSATLRQRGGFEFTGRLDVNVIALLSGCDGSRKLRDLLAEMAQRLGVNFDNVAPVGIEIMRSLMRSGFLTAPEYPSFAT